MVESGVVDLRPDPCFLNIHLGVARNNYSCNFAQSFRIHAHTSYLHPCRQSEKTNTN